VVTPSQNERVVYESGSTASPHLEAIHGIHDCSKGSSTDLNSWGPEVKNNREGCRAVDVRSGYFVFLAYSMVDLIKQWILEDPNHKLPPGITEERYNGLLAMHEAWKAKKLGGDGEKPIPTDIYHSGSDLTDGYAGDVIYELTEANQVAWSIAPEDPEYRVPGVFLQFASKYYEQTISPITMTKYGGVNVVAEFINKDDPIMKEFDDGPQLLYFNVAAWIFVPKMFAIVREVTPLQQ
jgi:hypothetical protein